MGTFLEEFKEEIIARMRSTGDIVEAWISQQLVSQHEMASITEAQTPQDQLRALFQAVKKEATPTKAALYLILTEKDPELISDLGKTNLFILGIADYITKMSTSELHCKV